MSSLLDPVILQKLQAFARRRRSLIILRGVFAAVAMLVGTMILVAGMDFLFPLMADWVRWTLSAVAYVAVLAIAWRLCLHQLLHAPDERQIARLVEHAEPQLREDLLSAVELGRSQGDVFDSDQFRGLLQTDVSARMQSLEMTALLPVALIQRYIGVTLAIAVAVVGLMLVSQNRFQTLFLRALMPGANLENVAGTQLFIEAPRAGDATVAQGDAVPVIIQVKGVPAKTANIEAIGTANGRHVSEMKALGGDRFATTIQVGRENVRYRMQAGDGRTRYFQLTAVARPHEVAFEKTYRFPAYAKIATKTVEEKTGGLTGLEGTEVELKITANQALKRGELRVDRGGAPVTIPLVALPDGRLSARLPLSASGTYRLHLVAARTDFESKFSPEYEIRAVPDLVPTAEFETPTEDLVAPANELVKIVARATDDVGLARVAQMVKVNDGPWKEVVLKEDAGLNTRVERDWDLAGEGVKANDLITTKLVSTDFKGGKAESRRLQIVIVPAATEMKRLASLASRKALGESVKALAVATAVLDHAASMMWLKFERTEAADPARKQVVAACATAFADCEAKLAQTWTTLDVPLRDAPANHEGSDLVLLGRLLSRINSGEVQPAGKLLALVATQPAAPVARDLASEIQALAAQAKTMTDLAHETYRFNLAAEQIDVVVELGLLVSGEQRRLRELAAVSKTPEDWGRVSTRLHAILGVSKNMDGVLESLKTGGGPIATQAEGLLGGAYFGAVREQIQEALNESADEKMGGLFESFTRHFGKAVSDSVNTKVLLSKLAAEATAARRMVAVNGADTPIGLSGSMHQYLAEQSEPTWTCVEKLRREQAVLANRVQLAPAERQGLIDGRWDATADTFKAHADLEEVRAVADNAFVGDLRRATVATLSVLALAAGDGLEKTDARLDVLAQSMRILEAGHDLQEVADGITALIALDRWEVKMPHGRTTMPRDWAWLSTRLLMAPARFQRLEVKDADARQALDEAAALLGQLPASAPFRAVTFEMGERRKFRHTPLVARIELEQVGGKLRAALALLRGPLETARKNVLKLTPSISELALALAKEEAALKADSNQAASKAATAKAEETKSAVAPQLARQQKINGKIETLKDLIRADANMQNILKKDQRDRMRDADDALAMLKEPPPAAEQALRQVTQSSDVAQQQTDLDGAVEQEQKIVEALRQIGGHYAALEQGKNPEETRAALRQAEEDLGIKAKLDEDFAKAAMLAEMATKDAQTLLNELVAKLPENPEAQQELEKIANTTLDLATAELERAAKAEGAAAVKVDERIAKDNDPKLKLSVLEAARLAAALTREAQVAAESARQFLDQAANKPGLERARVATERTTLAVPFSDQLVEAAQRLTNSRKVEEVVAEANGVFQKVGQLVSPLDHAKNEAKAAADSAAKEAQKADEQQEHNQQGGQAATLSGEKALAGIEAARQAEAAARDLAERAQAMAKIPEGAPQNSGLAQASTEQAPVQGDATEAAADVARASRHEERLGNSEPAQQLGDLAKLIDSTAKKAVPAAEKAIRESKQAADAKPPVDQAAKELADEAAALKKAAAEAKESPSSSADSPPGSPSASSPAEQKELAQAIDALDAQLADAAAAAAAAAAEAPPGQGPPGEGPPGEGPPGEGPPGEGPPGEGPPGEGPPGAMASMAQSKMASMRQSRSTKPALMPGIPGPFDPKEKSEKGAKFDGMPPSQGQPPELTAMKRGDWGKLPKKLAEQLSRGSAEDLPADYREAIETYYRVVAERAKQP